MHQSDASVHQKPRPMHQSRYVLDGPAKQVLRSEWDSRSSSGIFLSLMGKIAPWLTVVTRAQRLPCGCQTARGAGVRHVIYG